MKNLIATFLLGLLLMIPGNSIASVWQRQAADSTGEYKGEYCSLVLDSQDNPHIAYFDEDFGDLLYASFSNGSWTVEIVDSIGYTGENCSLAMDTQDRPHISYSQQYLGNYWSLKYATKTDSGWVKIIIDTPKDTSYYESGGVSSIAIDGNGFPCISYTQLGPDKLKYAYQDESGWHITDVADIYDKGFTKLVFDNTGRPVIGFRDYETNDTVYNNRLRIAYLNQAGSSSSIVTVPDSIGCADDNKLGFDMDSQNNAWFSYLKYMDGLLRIAVYNGSTWNIETVTEDPGFTYSPGMTLKIDRLGRPSIVEFYYGDEVRLYQKTNRQWQYQIVDKEEYGVTPIAHCSLAFDSKNYPHIAIQGETTDYSRVGLFYYLYWPGNAQIVIPEISHDFGTVWTQSYTDWNCSFINSGDAPLIISNLELYYSSWDESMFQIVNDNLPLTILPNEKDSITIRFKPASQTVYTDTLYISSNDSLNTILKIVLHGGGSTSWTKGDLKLGLESLYIDHDYQLIKHDIPLKNARVSLYKTSQLMYGPITTNSNGQVEFTDIDTGRYDVRIIKPVMIPGDNPGTTILDSLGITSTIQIGPGTNNGTIQFPDSLITEKYQDIYKLTHITRTSWEDSHTFYYPAENDVHSMLDSWKANLPSSSSSSVSRLILAEGLTYQMFDGGYSIGKEFMSDIGELMDLVKYSENWGTSIFEILRDIIVGLITGDPLAILKDILMEVLQEFLQNMLLHLITDGVHQVTAEIGPPGEPIVNTAWDVIKSNYSGWSIGFFSSANWGNMAGEIYKKLKNPVFQEVYINLMTDPKIEKATNYSRNFQYGGEFREAYNSSNYFIANKLEDIENTKDICVGLRVSADLFNKTANILNVLEILPIPGLDIIVAISTAMQITAYVEVLSAMGISGYTFFSLPDNINDAIERIYQVDLKSSPDLRRITQQFQRKKALPEVVENLKENLEASTSAYDSILTEIKNQINAGDEINAVMSLNDLMQAESDLRSSFNTTTAPARSVASFAKDSLNDFKPVYDSLKSSYAFAGENRLKNYLYVLFSPTDSSQAMKDSISAQIDRSFISNQNLKNQILLTLNTIADENIPAIVVASLSKQDKFGLEPNETGSIQLQIQNVGSLPAEDISILMKSNPAIQVAGTDSVYIGSLSPGEKSTTYTWAVNALSSEYSTGTWTAEIHSSNAKTYSTDGSFKILAEASGIKEQSNPANNNAYTYPNPINPGIESTTIYYRLKTTARVSIKIYDTNGKLVRILLNKNLKAANTEHIIRWNGKNEKGLFVPAGMYLYIIETGSHESLTGRIIIAE